MITYDVSFWGLPLLWRLYGSAFPRAILFGGLAGGGTALLYYYGGATQKNTLSNPFMYQIFAFVVGFALVFRSSLAYNRFWEARTTLQIIMGRLTYFTVQTLSMDAFSAANPNTVSEEQKRATFRFHVELRHYVSLLFALMLRHLRKDFGVDEKVLYEHRLSQEPPVLDAAEFVRGWKRLEVFLVKMLSLHDIFEHLDMSEQPHEMPVIGGVSAEERNVLLAPIDVPEAQGNPKLLQATRCFAMYARINRLLFSHLANGGLKVAPPIVAGLRSPLEEAMAAFGQATKLATTQFPFPWAQVVLAFLVMMAATLPFVVVTFVKEIWIGILLTWMIVTTYWSLNEVATEMEDPFGFDPNDLPMARYAFDFNQGLLSATWQLRPEYFNVLEKAEAQEHIVADKAAAMPGVLAANPSSYRVGSSASAAGMTAEVTCSGASHSSMGRPKKSAVLPSP